MQRVAHRRSDEVHQLHREIARLRQALEHVDSAIFEADQEIECAGELRAFIRAALTPTAAERAPSIAELVGEIALLRELWAEAAAVLRRAHLTGSSNAATGLTTVERLEDAAAEPGRDGG